MHALSTRLPYRFSLSSPTPAALPPPQHAPLASRLPRRSLPLPLPCPSRSPCPPVPVPHGPAGEPPHGQGAPGQRDLAGDRPRVAPLAPVPPCRSLITQEASPLPHMHAPLSRDAGLPPGRKRLSRSRSLCCATSRSLTCATWWPSSPSVPWAWCRRTSDAPRRARSPNTPPARSTSSAGSRSCSAPPPSALTARCTSTY
jgi:hypothetical protein